MKNITVILPIHTIDGDYGEMLTKAVESVEQFHDDVILNIVGPKDVVGSLTKEGLSDKEDLSVDAKQVISENTSVGNSKTELIKNTIEPGFYVQHTARGDLESVLEIQRGYPVLQNSIIFKLKKTQVEGFFYVLLSGPFETLDDANAFTTRDGIPRETWIRGALSIRPLIAAP